MERQLFLMWLIVSMWQQQPKKSYTERMSGLSKRFLSFAVGGVAAMSFALLPTSEGRVNGNQYRAALSDNGSGFLFFSWMSVSHSRGTWGQSIV